MKKQKNNKEIYTDRNQRSSVIGDFDDLIFEKRNKAYGAYLLRKKYRVTLNAGTVVASVLVSLAVLIPYLESRKPDRVISAGRSFVQVRMDNLEQPQEQIYIPPSAPPRPADQIQESVRYVPPVVVDSVLPVQQNLMTMDQVLSSTDNEQISTVGSGLGDDLLSGEGSGDREEALFQVEVMPSFKGGDISKFRDWVAKRTNYPQAAIEKRIRGTVYLTFIVEKDGSVSSVTIVKGVHPLLDNEAVKVISESPKWTPGLQRGQPVRVRFQIPLSFI
jgi:protein TonB